MSETSAERETCRLATRQGWFERKLKWQGRSGAPDRLFIKHGRVVFIEFKDIDEDVVPGSIQDRELRRMVDHEAEVHVCHSVVEASKVLGLG